MHINLSFVSKSQYDYFFSLSFLYVEEELLTKTVIGNSFFLKVYAFVSSLDTRDSRFIKSFAGFAIFCAASKPILPLWKSSTTFNAYE